MKKNNFLNLMAGIIFISSVASCNKKENGNTAPPGIQKATLSNLISEKGSNPDESVIIQQSTASNANAARQNDKRHFVYTESNAATQNEILVYEILADGSLRFSSSVASGGSGTGNGLGSQGALILNKTNEWLYAVNAGSNTVSSFKVRNDGSLKLAYTVSSGGTGPNSISIYGNLLYTLNHGSDNISGFKIGDDGRLSSIELSTRALSASGTDAPEISFTPGGDWIIVTEKATNKINSFKVNSNGSILPAIVTSSTGATPFGFGFARDRFMIVSNAAGGGAGAGSGTSYTIGVNGIPEAINGAIPDFEAAPCWIAVTAHGRFVYTTNTASNSISSYYVAPWGGLYLAQQVAASTDNGPVDVVVASNNYNVYVLNGKAATIGSYHRVLLGGLSSIGSVTGLPASATGLASN